MNTWRDIKTAPKHQPVLVTAEGMVCFGRFCDFEDEDYSGLAFDGACLSDGESVSYFADYIDGWQPAPATFQAEKSADEMFRELGYEKAHSLDDSYFAYANGNNRICVTDETVIKWYCGIPCPMTLEETLACAQFIKEREENNG